MFDKITNVSKSFADEDSKPHNTERPCRRKKSPTDGWRDVNILNKHAISL